MLYSSVLSECSKASISPTGITFYNGKGVVGSGSGSSSYGVHGEVLFPKSRENKKQKRASGKPKEKRTYRVNSTLVRSKVHAFAKLRGFKSFFAFYSISFPEGMPDLSAMKALNIWLTRVRKLSPKIEYVWVAERQKNGTIHFHCLVDRFLNIRVVNWYMSKAIQGVLRSDGVRSIEFNRARYNGVDVKRVFNMQGVKAYLTKYMAKGRRGKNDKSRGAVDRFKCRANGFSRLVSKLFTKWILSANEGLRAWFLFRTSDECNPFERSVWLAEGVLWVPWKNGPPSWLYRNVESANRLLFNELQGR